MNERKEFAKEFKRHRREAHRKIYQERRKMVIEQRRQGQSLPPVARWTAEPGSELADLRVRVHRAYDPLWDFGMMTRSEMYRRLAKVLRIRHQDCHIGMFNETLCRRALAVRNDPIFRTESVIDV